LLKSSCNQLGQAEPAAGGEHTGELLLGHVDAERPRLIVARAEPSAAFRPRALEELRDHQGLELPGGIAD
jgi:hypothetical protein